MDYKTYSFDIMQCYDIIHYIPNIQHEISVSFSEKYIHIDLLNIKWTRNNRDSSISLKFTLLPIPTIVNCNLIGDYLRKEDTIVYNHKESDYEILANKLTTLIDMIDKYRSPGKNNVCKHYFIRDEEKHNKGDSDTLYIIPPTDIIDYLYNNLTCLLLAVNNKSDRNKLNPHIFESITVDKLGHYRIHLNKTNNRFSNTIRSVGYCRKKKLKCMVDVIKIYLRADEMNILLENNTSDLYQFNEEVSLQLTMYNMIIRYLMVNNSQSGKIKININELKKGAFMFAMRSSFSDNKLSDLFNSFTRKCRSYNIFA